MKSVLVIGCVLESNEQLTTAIDSFYDRLGLVFPAKGHKKIQEILPPEDGRRVEPGRHAFFWQKNLTMKLRSRNQWLFDEKVPGAIHVCAGPETSVHRFMGWSSPVLVSCQAGFTLKKAKIPPAVVKFLSELFLYSGSLVEDRKLPAVLQEKNLMGEIDIMLAEASRNDAMQDDSFMTLELTFRQEAGVLLANISRYRLPFETKKPGPPISGRTLMCLPGMDPDGYWVDVSEKNNGENLLPVSPVEHFLTKTGWTPDMGRMNEWGSREWDTFASRMLAKADI